jgi:predicted CoA-binding protein
MNPGGKAHQSVAILGASDNPERYSNRALKMLREHGHRPLPVHPKLTEIDGVPVVPGLGDLPDDVDTLTVYLAPVRSRPLADEIVSLAPGRVILNPGTEDPELEARLESAGLPIEKACTLVLLSTGQF